MSDRLEQALFNLGQRIEYPKTPDLGVTYPARSERRISRRWRIAAAVAVAALVLLAFPGPRQAVANLFRIGAVTLTVVDDLRPAAVEREPSGLMVSFEKAQEEVGFLILTLEPDPDAVYLDPSVSGGMVTLGYGADDDGYSLLITQLLATTDEQAVTKLLTPSTSVESVTVEGEPGFWIEGDPHVVILFDQEGDLVEDSARLAANTLLYIVGDRTVRIEGGLSLDQALEVAAALE